MSINLTTPVNTNCSLNTGLTAWWMTLPGVSYTTSITDFVGSKALTVANGASFSGASQYFGTTPIRFDGTNDAAGTSGDSPTWDLTAVSGDFTLSAWVYLNDTTFSTFMTQNTGDGLGWWLYYNSGFIILGFSRTSGGNYAGWAWTPSISTWYCITVTKTGTTYEGYVNGVSLGTFPESFTWVDRSGQLVVGALNSAGVYELNGYMDDIRIWSRALNSTEVAALYLDATRGYYNTIRRLVSGTMSIGMT